jgi:hypothetical protein
MSAWLMLRGECPNAAMGALSIFGPGMSLTGALLMIYLFVQNNRTQT